MNWIFTLEAEVTVFTDWVSVAGLVLFTFVVLRTVVYLLSGNVDALFAVIVLISRLGLTVR